MFKSIKQQFIFLSSSLVVFTMLIAMALSYYWISDEYTANIEKNNLIIKKRIYDLCKDAAVEELEALEAILFCDVNFPKTENPFYVTLFLTKVAFYMKETQ